MSKCLLQLLKKKLKANYHRNKAKIKKTIRELYHAHNGAPGYRIIHIYLCRKVMI